MYAIKPTKNKMLKGLIKPAEFGHRPKPKQKVSPYIIYTTRVNWKEWSFNINNECFTYIINLNIQLNINTFQLVQNSLAKYQIQQVPQPPYLPDMAPCAFFFYSKGENAVEDE